MADDPMLTALRWVEDAVSALDVGVTPLTSFYLANGHVHAHNGRMVAATRFPDFPGEALVAAKAFTKVLANRPPGAFAWHRETSTAADGTVSDTLVLKRGRFTGKVKMLPLTEWVMPTREPEVKPVPPNFAEAVEKLLPFCSENATHPWATCLSAKGDHLYATNNVALARASCPGVGAWGEFLLPRWAAAFVAGRMAGLLGWEVTEQYVTFAWADGSWMRSSLILAKFPNLSAMLDTLGETPCDVTPGWLACLNRVVDVCEDPIVRLKADGIYGSTGEVLQVEDGTGVPLPDGRTETLWDARYLVPVLTLATHWDPAAYPKPAPWRGPGVEGVVLGRMEHGATP